jgi:hypothetical protein
MLNKVHDAGAILPDPFPFMSGTLEKLSKATACSRVSNVRASITSHLLPLRAINLQLRSFLCVATRRAKFSVCPM